MGNPQIQQNQIPNNPELSDLLNLLKKDIFLSLNSHHIGTVQSFDATKQTVTATINYTKTFYELDSTSGLYNPIQIAYPQLIDCPAIVLGGGGAALTFPIAQGDECLVLFNDRDMDNWFAGASAGAVASPRLHSFSDGIVLVGLRSLNNVLANYDNSRAVLRNGQAYVGVGETLIKIANNATTLNTLLQSLVNAIKAITTIDSNSDTGTISVASQAALAAIGTQIGGLLE